MMMLLIIVIIVLLFLLLRRNRAPQSPYTNYSHPEPPTPGYGGGFGGGMGRGVGMFAGGLAAGALLSYLWEQGRLTEDQYQHFSSLGDEEAIRQLQDQNLVQQHEIDDLRERLDSEQAPDDYSTNAADDDYYDDNSGGFDDGGGDDDNWV